MKFSKLKDLFVTMCLCALSANAHAQSPDSSGIWSMNENTSNFAGQNKESMFKRLNVVQTKDSLIVQGGRYNEQGFPSAPISYPLNGDTVKILLSNARTMKAIVRIDLNAKNLSRRSYYSLPNEPQSEDYRSDEKWNLSNDGTILTLTRIFTKGEQTVEVKAVYERLKR